MDRLLNPRITVTAALLGAVTLVAAGVAFVPEADRYPGTTRICTAEPLLDAVRRLHHTEALDLIIAPAVA